MKIMPFGIIAVKEVKKVSNMEFRETSRLLHQKECLRHMKYLGHYYSKCRIHNRHETSEHFMAKAMLMFMIFSKGEKAVLTEVETRSGRTIDVLQVNKKGELVGYEIENTKNIKSGIAGIDIVEIPLKKLPKEAKAGLKVLENWLKEYAI